MLVFSAGPMASMFLRPFMGSGTTLIAAETIGRICLAMELEPRYVDVAVRRWQAFTGLKATLLSDGRLFEAIAAERHERCSGDSIRRNQPVNNAQAKMTE